MKDDPTFPDRLARLMNEKNMSRAELARHVWGTIIDERGYEVAKNRQSISKYLSGKAVPSQRNLQLLAEALRVSYEEIDPLSDPATRIGSGITLTTLDKNTSRLDISVNLPIGVASQVISLVAPFTT